MRARMHHRQTSVISHSSCDRDSSSNKCSQDYGIINENMLNLSSTHSYDSIMPTLPWDAPNVDCRRQGMRVPQAGACMAFQWMAGARTSMSTWTSYFQAARLLQVPAADADADAGEMQSAACTDSDASGTLLPAIVCMIRPPHFVVAALQDPVALAVTLQPSS